MEFTKENCQKIYEKTKALLKSLEEEFNIQVKLGSGSFTHNSLSTRIQFLKLNKDGKRAKDKEDFMLYAYRYGLESSDFGKKFTSQNGEYTICGIKPKSRKYPILAKHNESGKIYKFSGQYVKMLLA